MSKRDKILTVVVVLLFGSAGYVLYSGLFADQITVVTNQAPDIEANKKTIVNLLPHGSNLDFSKVKQRLTKLQITSSAIYTYPTVSSSDIGVPVTDLLKNK